MISPFHGVSYRREIRCRECELFPRRAYIYIFLGDTDDNEPERNRQETAANDLWNSVDFTGRQFTSSPKFQRWKLHGEFSAVTLQTNANSIEESWNF